MLENATSVDLKIMHSNIRGFLSKKTSLLENVECLRPDVICLNEHGLRGKNKVNIPGYFTFTKNRVAQAMGGVSISLDNGLKQDTVKVKDGSDDDEYIIVRIDKFAFPINIVSYYGEQEGRTAKDKIAEKWWRLEKDLECIRNRREEVIIIGDFNKQIGSDEIGITGNNKKISFGGKLVRDLLFSEECSG